MDASNEANQADLSQLEFFFNPEAFLLFLFVEPWSKT